ncbi:lactoylglutathione lyase [Thiothrix caldifontis]|uniref:Lactoylglutathione lyase n=1 Tax=Thiothrix caldifontis TaxID=525918 RepID=A0A1H4GFT9_9GAMM|nr:ArsI/CadI family heavy metal resistance metalloenzyme [Thiothrix caldifontis]SEB08347.1 lactoylglutathione lyase [Thiothrix caldifontis]
MKRFHVHLSVDDLAQSIGFYNKLFGQTPSVERSDYAKWMLEDPRVNFAISARGHTLGVNHFGFQAEDAAELQELKQRAQMAAGDAVLDQGETACCYAKSDKHWTVDPAGFAWEHYQTMGELQEFGVDRADTSVDCCVPLDSVKKSTCC